MTADDEELSPEDIAWMQETFLERHDRDTSGIPGIFPLVYNLPMRFTAHKDREGGAFKNTQCKLVGWELPPEEEARVAAIQENEITLRVMPIALHVKLLRPTKNFKSRFGEGVLRLKPEYKIWSRDKDLNAKVRRKGFEVVPDFGGTAHAYCGESLEVATGDLFEWHRHPTHESM